MGIPAVWASAPPAGNFPAQALPAVWTDSGLSRVDPLPPLAASPVPYAIATGFPSATLAYGRPVFMPIPAKDPNVYAHAVRRMSGADWMPPAIFHALILLAQIRHLPQDELHMRREGVDILFRNGEEALNLILRKGIRVEFGDMGNVKAHAQFVKDQNLIMINQKYQGNLSTETLYAISEAIYHEAGHVVRWGDDTASLQEEINCLALNTLAHRFHIAIDPAYAASGSDSELITDGVALYSKLFFDTDPAKKALVKRIIQKYGELPPEGPDHRVPVPSYSPYIAYQPPLVDRVLRQIQENNATQRFALALQEALPPEDQTVTPRQWIA